MVISEKICFAIQAVEFGGCERILVLMIITGMRRPNNLVGLLAKSLNGVLQNITFRTLASKNKKDDKIRTRRSDAGRQAEEDAESNNEVRLSNSSKAGIVKYEVGARVARIHIIVLKKKVRHYLFHFKKWQTHSSRESMRPR